jgi:hypothetical protein
METTTISIRFRKRQNSKCVTTGQIGMSRQGTGRAYNGLLVLRAYVMNPPSREN